MSMCCKQRDPYLVLGTVPQEHADDQGIVGLLNSFDSSLPRCFYDASPLCALSQILLTHWFAEAGGGSITGQSGAVSMR